MQGSKKSHPSYFSRSHPNVGGSRVNISQVILTCFPTILVPAPTRLVSHPPK